MNLFEKVEKALSFEAKKDVWRKDINSYEYNYCSRLNKELFGMPFNGTPKCYCIDDFFQLLKYRYSKKKIQEIMEKKYFIKEGLIVRPFGMKPLDRNSSDEDCIKLLKMNPLFIKNFDIYPDDWNGKPAPAPAPSPKRKRK